MDDSEIIEKGKGEDIARIIAQLDFAISSGRKKPKEIDLEEYILKLREKIRSGKLDDEIISTLSTISKILETKIDILLNELLGKKVSLKDIAFLLDVSALLQRNEIESDLVQILSVLHPVGTLYLPIQEQEIIDAYLELTMKRNPGKYGSNAKAKPLELDLVDFVPKSIEDDKRNLFEKLEKHDIETIPFSKILSKYPSWREVLNKLTVLTYLAHEGSIAMWQKDFPDGEIFLKTKKLTMTDKRSEDESS
jgi:DUF438 domain-containing protein